MKLLVNKEHCTLGFVFNYNVNEMNKAQLEKFVSENIRQASAKTGKPVKVNVFKWTKEDLKSLVNDYLNMCYNYCEA